MDTVITILLTILIFGIIIFVHELGHFIVARLSHVKVNEFAMGMGPKLIKIQGKQTLYTLRLFPIGGFCSMEGEDEESEDSGAFTNAPVYKRILICIAGAAMNIILGFILMAMSLIGTQYYNTTTVAVFNENPTTSQTGLKEGDKIVKMNNTTIFTDRDIVFEILRDDDGTIPMEVIRNNERVKLDAVKFTVKGTGQNRSIYLDFKVVGEKGSFFGALSLAGRNTLSYARNAVVSIGDLVTGRIGFGELSGPVGVGKVVGEASKMGYSTLMTLAAYIAISIGVFNLLPFPALDGGRVIFLIIEGIRRKPINRKWEGYVNAAGLILLFGLMIVITCKDILGLF